MARRSLKPQLNQIRTWVRQGRTDAWIAHQLEVTVKDLRTFKQEHDLAPDDAGDDADAPVPALEDERDLREEDDALIAAELDAIAEKAEDEEAEPAAEREPEDASEEDAQRPRRRGRRGGRRRRTSGGRGRRQPLEGTFDHGEEGYGLWLDPGVQDDPVYAEHWAGHRPVTVTIEPDRIVIRRSGEQDDATGSDVPEAAESAAAEPDPDEFAA